MKTTAKVFQAQKCSICKQTLSLPSIHFMCGHSFHENCLDIEKEKKDCILCIFDDSLIIERKDQINKNVFFIILVLKSS